jgi:hypothetical protein
MNNEPNFGSPHSGGIRVFALTQSRRIVFNDAPWLISFSLGGAFTSRPITVH